MVRSEKILSNVDWVCDYSPISPLNNIVNLFLKTAILPFLHPETRKSSHYITHLDNKSFKRCLLLSIPGGNIPLMIYDFVDYKRNYREIQEGYSLKDRSFKFLDNKKLAKIAIEKDPQNFEHISPWLKNDRDLQKIVAKAAIKNDVKNFQYFKPWMKDDPELFELALQKNPFLIMLSEKFKTNLKYLLIALKQDPKLANYLPEELFQDDKIKKVIIESIAAKKLLFSDLNPTLQNDSDIQLLMKQKRPATTPITPTPKVETVTENIQVYTPHSRLDRLCTVDRYSDYLLGVSIVSNLFDIALKGLVFPFLKEETIRHSRYFSHVREKSLLRCMFLTVAPGYGNLAILALDKIALNHVTHQLRENGELESLHFKYRDNKKLARIALQKDGKNFNYLSKRLQHNPEFFALALQNKCPIEDMFFAFQGNKKLALIAVESVPTSYKSLSKDLQLDEDIFKVAFDKDPNIILDAPEKFKNNTDYWLKAIEQNPRLYLEVNRKLFTEDEFALFTIEALKRNIHVSNHLPETWIETPAIKRMVRESLQLDVKPFFYNHVLEAAGETHAH